MKSSTSVVPQTLLIRRTFWPVGDTSTMRTSAGLVCPKRCSVTLTSVIGPVIPSTVTLEGYGEAGPLTPLPGTAIAESFLKLIESAEALPASSSAPATQAARDVRKVRHAVMLGVPARCRKPPSGWFAQTLARGGNAPASSR